MNASNEALHTLNEAKEKCKELRDKRNEITIRTSNRGHQIRNTEAYNNPHLNTIEDLSVQIGEVNAEIRTVLKPKYEELMAKMQEMPMMSMLRNFLTTQLAHFLIMQITSHRSPENIM